MKDLTIAQVLEIFDGKCHTCRWWNFDGWYDAVAGNVAVFEYRDHTGGECRRNAPDSGGFYFSTPCDWCGEYEFYGNYE